MDAFKAGFEAGKLASIKAMIDYCYECDWTDLNMRDVEDEILKLEAPENPNG